MNSRQAYVIKIYLPDGDPDGLKIIEKSNWNGSGLVIPRALFSQGRQRREIGRAGIYVLIGPSEHSGLPLVYIGEGDPIRPRIEQQASKKDFWTTAFAFTSKDENLNKAHVQYLEAQLVQLASQAKRCELDNANVPQLPSLSEADVAEARAFLTDMLLCFPVLGVGVFEKTAAAAPKAKELILKGKGIEARGFESAQGFVVLSGSRAVREEVPSIQIYQTALRRALIDRGVLKQDAEDYVLTQDYTFASPSTAAAVLLGRSANGRLEWKTKDGRTLKGLQDGEATS